MIVDLRYHIFSLAAVFLALGLGIAVGSALPGTDTLVQEQQKIISRLEKDFEQLRAERRAVQEIVKGKELEVEVLQQFHREILPLLIGGMLDGYRVVIIHTGGTGEEETIRDLSAFLHEAGAGVAAVLSFTRRPDLRWQEESLAESLGFSTGKQWVKEFWSELAAELNGEKAPAVLSALQELGLIRRSDLPAGPIDAMIVLGGEKTGAGFSYLELALAAAAREAGWTVIGTETLPVQNSWIPGYKSIGLTTVDNIDTIPGRVALVFTLAGGGEGHYGVKETATGLLPPLPGGEARRDD